MQAALAMDDLDERLTQEALGILGGISVRWQISVETAARLADISVMGYLRRHSGYDSSPLPKDVVHRITALGLIDRALTNTSIDPSEWFESPIAEAPFHGKAPAEVLPGLDMESLIKLNIEINARRGRPVEVALPHFSST